MYTKIKQYGLDLLCLQNFSYLEFEARSIYFTATVETTINVMRNVFETVHLLYIKN